VGKNGTFSRPEIVGYPYGCAPELILDHAGVAFVTSDVLPVIWRVDPQRPEISRIELSLDSHRDKDVGFSEILFAADGTLLSAGTTFASHGGASISPPPPQPGSRPTRRGPAPATRPR
jgi:hypothetical protein